MKKLLFLFLVIGLIASCCHNETDDIAEVDDMNKINFMTLRDKSVTRYANDNKDEYQVYAVIEGQSSWFIDDSFIPSTTSGTDTASNNKVYYWPGTQTVNFYAFAPIAGSSYGVTVAEATPSSSASTIEIDYVVPSTAEIGRAHV